MYIRTRIEEKIENNNDKKVKWNDTLNGNFDKKVAAEIIIFFLKNEYYFSSYYCMNDYFMSTFAKPNTYSSKYFQKLESIFKSEKVMILDDVENSINNEIFIQDNLINDSSDGNEETDKKIYKVDYKHHQQAIVKVRPKVNELNSFQLFSNALLGPWRVLKKSYDDKPHFSLENCLFNKEYNINKILSLLEFYPEFFDFMKNSLNDQFLIEEIEEWYHVENITLQFDLRHDFIKNKLSEVMNDILKSIDQYLDSPLKKRKKFANQFIDNKEDGWLNEKVSDLQKKLIHIVKQKAENCKLLFLSRNRKKNNYFNTHKVRSESNIFSKSIVKDQNDFLIEKIDSILQNDIKEIVLMRDVEILEDCLNQFNKEMDLEQKSLTCSGIFKPI